MNSAPTESAPHPLPTPLLETLQRTGRSLGAERPALILLIVLAGLLRAHDIDHLSLWQDEGLSLYRAGLPWRGILSGEIPLDALITKDVQPPLYFLLLSAFFDFTGASAFTGKWFSLLASLPTIPLVWVLSRRLLGDKPSARRSARFAAGLAALSPVYLWYSQEIRGYTLQLTFGLLGVYALLRAITAWEQESTAFEAARAESEDPEIWSRDGSARRTTSEATPPSLVTRPSTRWTIVAIVANACLLWTHYLGFFLVAFEALYLVLYIARSQTGEQSTARLFRTMIPLAGLGLAALPLIPFALERLGIGPERDQHFVALPRMLRDIVFGFGFGRSAHAGNLLRPAEAPFMLAAELALWCLLFWGAWRLWAHRRQAFFYTLGFLLIPLLGLYAVTYIKPVYMGVRHILLVSPAFYLLVGSGMAASLEQASRAGVWPTLLPEKASSEPGSGPGSGATASRTLPAAALGLVTTIIALAGMAFAADNYYITDDSSLQKDDHRALARYVAERAIPGDVLIIPHPVLRYVYQYYLPEMEIVTVPPFLVSGLRDERSPAELLDPLLDEKERVWFIDPNPDFEAWLDDNALTVDKRVFPASSIVLDMGAWERAPDLSADDAPERRETVVLGDLELWGWSVMAPDSSDMSFADQALMPPESESDTVISGLPARLQLMWIPPAPEPPESSPRPDYKVALELLDAEGRNWADGDHEPFHGLYPTSRWPAQELTYEPHELIVRLGTPPGSYRLAIRAYDPETGEAYPAGGPADLGEVRVVSMDREEYDYSRSGRRRDYFRPEPRLPTTIDVHRSGRAGGFRFLGYDLENSEAGTWDSGGELPLYVWAQQEQKLELEVTSGERGESISAYRYEAPTRILAEMVNARGRVETSGEIVEARGQYTDSLYAPDAVLDLSADELLLQPGNGHLWRRALPVKLPTEAGRYGLRLKVYDRDGSGPRTIRRGPFGLFPTRSLWLTTIEVAERERIDAVPDFEHSLDVKLENVANLLGHDGPASEFNAKAEAIDLNATDTLTTTLYWRAGSGAEAEGGLPTYHVTVQLLPTDADSGEVSGAPVAQHDGVPANGERPTGGWRADEIIIDQHSIALPADLPEGHYMLIAALYDPDQALPRPIAVQDGTERDHVVLGHLELNR